MARAREGGCLVGGAAAEEEQSRPRDVGVLRKRVSPLFGQSVTYILGLKKSSSTLGTRPAFPSSFLKSFPCMLYYISSPKRIHLLPTPSLLRPSINNTSSTTTLFPLSASASSSYRRGGGGGEAVASEAGAEATAAASPASPTARAEGGDAQKCCPAAAFRLSFKRRWHQMAPVVVAQKAKEESPCPSPSASSSMKEEEEALTEGEEPAAGVASFASRGLSSPNASNKSSLMPEKPSCKAHSLIPVLLPSPIDLLSLALPPFPPCAQCQGRAAFPIEASQRPMNGGDAPVCPRRKPRPKYGHQARTGGQRGIEGGCARVHPPTPLKGRSRRRLLYRWGKEDPP